MRDEWAGYLLEGCGSAEFRPGSRVLDVGCGRGEELARLERSQVAVGMDVSHESVAHCRSRGLKVLRGKAEAIPLRTGSMDGLFCKVVIPYTDEARALCEIGRVLKTGGTGHLCYHGVGYYLRYLLLDRSWKRRFYGLRSILNTWFYAITNRRLPWFWGDTIYQSRRRLARHYGRSGLELFKETQAKSFLGFPVFIYHSIRRVRPDADSLELVEAAS